MHDYRPDPDHTPEDHHLGPDYEGPIEEHPLWQRENVILRSVGVDVGSAGTQILFSQLHLRRQGADLSSRYLVVGRQTWFESPVCLTPYESETLIDARALGASEYTAQLRGNTSYISNPRALLPRRNIQVLRPDFDFTDDFDADCLADAIHQHMTRFDVVDSDADVALAFHWRGVPEFRRVAALAEGVRKGMTRRIARGHPLYVILDADIAMNLGAILQEDLAPDNEVLVIDGIALWDFDYIDLGRMRLPSGTVPVSIKSLGFHDVVEGPQRHQRVHHPPHRSLED